MKETAYSVLSTIFTVTVILFMLMGMAIALVQIIGILIGNGAMVLGINSALKTPAIAVSAICGFAGFFASYCKPAKKA